jgi:CheY-like chemotaxis protein
LSDRPSVLLVHDDSELLDTLTRLFESRGFAVAIAATGFSALTQLQGRRHLDVIIAGWNVGRGVGAEVYRWALAHRFHLRQQFVFLADEEPAEFQALVEGRCLLLRPSELGEIVRVAESAALRRRRRISEAPDDLEWVDAAQPTLLLIEDDALMLHAMQLLLADAGFAVTAAESGNAAIGLLEKELYDAILCDWLMPNGSGADVFAWAESHRPGLAGRIIFMSGGQPADFSARAPGRPLFRKGQDSPALVHMLKEAAKASRVTS